MERVCASVCRGGLRLGGLFTEWEVLFKTDRDRERDGEGQEIQAHF